MDCHFIKYIKTIVEIPELQQDKFCSLISIRHVKSGEEFLSAGRVPKTIAFLNSGLFRYYYITKDGHEFTKGFFQENRILVSYSAILEKRGSYFGIQALEDSIIEVIDYYEFEKLIKEHPNWTEFLVKLLQKAYIIKEKREREFLLLDAEQRYQSFLQDYPNLEKRIKQHIIASYLGITPESLSRIRKEIGLLT